jgi:transcriptional regulator with XRE-family HTH domain
MPSFINSTMKKIWKKMARKAYRDGYVSAHISNTIASQITKLRTAKGWTQTQLAEYAGMRQSRISALEDPNWQNVEVATLKRLASAFDVALTVRFIPFSELAQWAAALSDDKLLVSTYDEEATERVPVPARLIAEAGGAATAFFAAPEQESRASVYDGMRAFQGRITLPPLPKSGYGANAFGTYAIDPAHQVGA